jgi:hypothetical protein
MGGMGMGMDMNYFGDFSMSDGLSGGVPMSLGPNSSSSLSSSGSASPEQQQQQRPERFVPCAAHPNEPTPCPITHTMTYLTHPTTGALLAPHEHPHEHPPTTCEQGWYHNLECDPNPEYYEDGRRRERAVLCWSPKVGKGREREEKERWVVVPIARGTRGQEGRLWKGGMRYRVDVV